MRTKALAAAMLGTALLLAAAPTPWASAAARHEQRSASVTAELSLRGSGGYLLDLTDFGRGELLIATHSQNPRSEIESLVGEDVTYAIPATDSATDPAERLLDVRVGRLGHFRGHLKVTSTEEEKVESRCTGEPTVIEHGVFVGSFRFRGEAGYTRVRASRARGSITKSAPQECTLTGRRLLPGLSRRHGHAAKRPAGNYKLIASDLDGTYLEAEHRDEREVDSELTDFSVSVSTDLGDIGVDHLVNLADLEPDGEPTFAIPNLAAPLTEAALTPPAPFSGSATFRSDGLKIGDWSGDLAVRLPGLPATTPLTGDGIEAGLCAGRAGCTETLPPVLQPSLEAPPGVSVIVAIKK